MKKKGILFKVLIALLIVAIIVGIFMLVFSIKTFDMNYLNNVSKINKTELENFIDGYKGANTMFFSKSKFTEEVEKKFPQIDITNIERIPFSTVKISLVERFSMFAINKDSSYYVFDKDGFMIEKTDTNFAEQGEYANIELIGLKTELLENADKNFGTIPEFINTDEKLGYILKFIDIMGRLSDNYNDVQIKSMIESIELDIENNMTIQLRYGIKMVIYDFPTNTEGKITSILAAYTSGLATEPDDVLIVKNDLITVKTK